MADNLRDRLQAENFQSTPREPSQMSNNDIIHEMNYLQRMISGYVMVIDKLRWIGGNAEDFETDAQKFQIRFEALKNELRCRLEKGDLERTGKTEENDRVL